MRTNANVKQMVRIQKEAQERQEYNERHFTELKRAAHRTDRHQAKRRLAYVLNVLDDQDFVLETEF